MNSQLNLEKQQAATIRVLLIEDSPGDARLIQEMLEKAEEIKFELECVDYLSKGLERLTKKGIDIVLLDLSLPDSSGWDTFHKLRSQIFDVPIVVLTGHDDKSLGIKAVQEGAQDYLVKGKVESGLLSRAIRYAIERHRMLDELRSLSLKDDLTGLYNRRGFLTLSQQQLKTINRIGGEIFLVFADLNDLKKINDTLGHHEGDLALKEVASFLKENFRESDIIARISGDEFVILALKSPRFKIEILSNRIKEGLKVLNEKKDRRYKIELSIGITVYDSKSPCSIHELLAQADKLMYKEKQNKEK